MSSLLRDRLGTHILVADGAMGTMLQAHEPTDADFEGNLGCNEILNVTRPDIIADVHAKYLAAGADLIETNTFGANLTALGEYDSAHRIAELAGAGARIARQVADKYASAAHPRFVLGSVGPGVRLPSLGQVTFAELRDGYETQIAAMIEAGIDGVQIETCQDLLQVKAAVIGARRASNQLAVDVPVFVTITVEMTGTMLLGTEVGAALATLRALKVDAIGLNCATGPEQMREHLRVLSTESDLPLACLPNAGLPELTPEGPRYPLAPEALATALNTYREKFGLAIVGGCCGTTPEHIAVLAEAVRDQPVPARPAPEGSSVASLYQAVSLKQDTAFLNVGERTNANGSLAFRKAMLAKHWSDCVEIATGSVADGAHVLDLCVDYTGQDSVADMKELAGRFNTSVWVPIMLDSTEPAVLEAGLESLAGRCIINSVNYESCERFTQTMELVQEHGTAVVGLTIDESGQARTKEHKLEVATRLIEDLCSNWQMRTEDILIDCLTFPIATGQEETRRDGIATIEAIRELKNRYPNVGTTLGVSNISFGLKPAARVILNSVFLSECLEAGLDSAIVHSGKILPLSQIPEDQVKLALDLIYDRRTGDHDPLMVFIDAFADVTLADQRESQASRLAALPLGERLQQRVIEGARSGLTEDLDEAMETRPALEIVNTDLLAAMKIVGELFGSGKMQLPFVLQSAEVMKQAVGYLEPYMDATDVSDKGTIVLATVIGDVHDIGKNLVDIILTNNGYKVVNLGIKQPIDAIISAAESHDADAIGMSGLLVKSTQVMKENLEHMNAKGISKKYPVLLGGAALTRAYVEDDLNGLFEGEVRYARDAFAGLDLMGRIMDVKHGVPDATLPEPKRRRVTRKVTAPVPEVAPDIRSEIRPLEDRPEPPFWGSQIANGLPVAAVAEWLDKRALFAGQWGLRPGPEQSYDQLAAEAGEPRLAAALQTVGVKQLADLKVAYGYFPCHSEGNDLVVEHDDGSERVRFSFPRQTRSPHLCLADYFRDAEMSARLGPDVIEFQVVTLGERFSEYTAELFAADKYREYLELHGLGVQLAEALAEFWHARVREELGLKDRSADKADAIRNQPYAGSRYSFGYPACPNLEDRRKVMDLLGSERIGVVLSEQLQLHPEQSTDALVVHHPEAKYFNAT